MFKVLFISPAKTFVEGKRVDKFLTSRASPSLQAMTILGFLKAQGYETFFIDVAADGFENETRINEHLWRFGLSDGALVEKVRKINPDVILTTSMFTTEQMTVDSLCSLLKKHFPSIPIAVGGVHATYKPEWLLENRAIDFVVLGEGEPVIVNLLECLLRKTLSIEQVPGIAYRNSSGGIAANPRPPQLEDLDLPWEFEKVLFNEEGGYRYLQPLVNRSAIYEVPGEEVRVSSLYGSRGCPFHCSYCSATEKDGSRVRHIGARRMFQDVVMQREKFGVVVFQNQADTFGFNAEDVEFLELLASYRKTHPEITLANPNAFFTRIFFDSNLRIKTEFIELLKNAGFRVLTLAIDSFAQRFNKRINFSQITPRMIGELVRAIKKKGLKVELYMIYAYPDETLEEVENDKARLLELLEDADSLVWRSLTYFPGTEFYRFLMTVMPEEEYRKKIVNGTCFYNLVDEFNFSKVSTAKLKEIVESV